MMAFNFCSCSIYNVDYYYFLAGSYVSQNEDTIIHCEIVEISKKEFKSKNGINVLYDSICKKYFEFNFDNSFILTELKKRNITYNDTTYYADLYHTGLEPLFCDHEESQNAFILYKENKIYRFEMENVYN